MRTWPVAPPASGACPRMQRDIARSPGAATVMERKPEGRSMFLPKGNAAKSSQRRRSFRTSYVFVDQLSNLIQFFRRRLMAGERLHHKLLCGTVEGAFEQVIQQALSRMRALEPRRIQVRAFRLVSVQQTLVHHDLHQFEHRRITCGLPFTEVLIDAAHRHRPSLPEDLKNLQLSLGRLLRAFFWHA